jgi:hypothetical protein
MIEQQDCHLDDGCDDAISKFRDEKQLAKIRLFPILSAKRMTHPSCSDKLWNRELIGVSVVVEYADS